MSRQKAKGTAAETAFVKYARLRTGDETIDRIAPHGNDDKGDVGALLAHGLRGFAELKNYEGNPTRGQLERWQSETMRERANGSWDFGLLVVHEKGCNMVDPMSPTYGFNRCYMTLGDLARVSGLGPAASSRLDDNGKWCCMTVSDVFDLLED